MKGCVIMPLPQEKIYTIEDIYNLPEGTRAELIDGQIYYIAPPTRRHPRNRLKYIPTTKNTPLSKEAKTAFYKIINNNKIELIGAKLFSGRTHQIRAHLSKIQRHILGDAFYGYKGNYTTRILLHSHLLYLTHPTTKQRLEIYAPFWEDMLLFLHQEFYPTQNLEYFKKNFKIPLDQLYHSSFSNS